MGRRPWNCRAASASGRLSRPSCGGQLFLFDEPLSNLDAALGWQRIEIARLRDLAATMIYVTTPVER